ncbi:Gfo/Idh/MocA family protein [Anatilimnocola floriformis]|uniref:Gfo/Idh/MocA family protein n=1 Tax=Anatilimnocola floriformis TaxID=2948575 RepID=UPI0020C4D43C|nr:Gfo/Idh/MocA family oxidoreductase [Anatilimnocola floriformis]
MKTSRRTFFATTAAVGLTQLNGGSTFAQTKPKIKIGQIGTGHAHASKLSVYRASDDYEVVGVVESDDKQRARAEKAAVYKDLPWMTREQLLNTPGLQAVLIETQVADLLENAGHAIAAGKHVHLDKPAGASLPQYREILKQAEATKLLVQMGYMFRYSPAVLLMRKFLKEGWLGDLFEVHTVMSKVVGAGERDNLAQFPGGIMFELGCHVIDLVVSTLGKPDRVQAFARHSSTRADKLADNMLAVFEYPKATASVKSSAIEVDGGSRRHFVVCGTQGSFHIQPLDAPNVTYTLDRDQGEYKKGRHEIKFGNYPRYVGDAADMAKIIRGEKECDYSYAHDLAVQETLLRACDQKVD